MVGVAFGDNANGDNKGANGEGNRYRYGRDVNTKTHNMVVRIRDNEFMALALNGQDFVGRTTISRRIWRTLRDGMEQALSLAR
jgi:hypothetical protein